MVRSLRVAMLLAAAIAPSGCTYEEDVADRPLTLTGTVTYRGDPVRKGAIHFLPSDPGRTAASGVIANGAIKDVFTKTQGDGIKPGRYKIVITSFDEAFMQSVAKRDAGGPDPIEVARAANNVKKLIPVRYSNWRESGLVAEVSVANHTLRLELID